MDKLYVRIRFRNPEEESACRRDDFMVSVSGGLKRRIRISDESMVHSPRIFRKQFTRGADPMKRFLILAACLNVVLSVYASPYTNPVKLVKDGLHEYETKGLWQATAIWEIDTTDEIIDTMKQSEKKFGRVTDHEIICRVDAGGKTAIVYAVVNYEYGRTFLEFSLYNSVNNWIVLGARKVDWSVCHEKLTMLRNAAALDETAKSQMRIASLLEEMEQQDASRNAGLLKAIDSLRVEVRSLPAGMNIDKSGR